MIVFVIENPYLGFTLLCNQVHQVWTQFFGATLEDRSRYNIVDCFETFPFPPNYESNPALEIAGKAYYDFRAELMVRNNEGLTKTYNHFHDPEETAPEILRLRELHAAMDRAVLDAYGWDDIPTACVFLLDWEDDEDEAPETGARSNRKKKPWRYRWPDEVRDEVRDEVLARLLALNAQWAALESQDDRRVTPSPTPPKPASKPRKRLSTPTMDLFGGKG